MNDSCIYFKIILHIIFAMLSETAGNILSRLLTLANQRFDQILWAAEVHYTD